MSHPFICLSRLGETASIRKVDIVEEEGFFTNILEAFLLEHLWLFTNEGILVRKRLILLY